MNVRAVLESLFEAGVAAADPRAATAEAVARIRFDAPPGIVALGKAAHRMSEEAVDALGGPRAHAGGLVISQERDGEHAAPTGLEHVTGDHPVPARMAAGEKLGSVVPRLRACRDVLVLLSGGASSLAAAPIDDVEPADLRTLFRELLRSGKDINLVNAVRRRVLRWSGGRLTSALHPARVHCLIVSDVMGNELAAIGSGPCVTDPTAHDDLLDALGSIGAQLAPGIARLLAPRSKQSSAGKDAEEVRILMDNRTAVDGVVRAAKAAGFHVAPGEPFVMRGEAELFGGEFARHLSMLRVHSLGAVNPTVCVAGGETVVTLASDAGLGGRCQELALAFAESAAGTSTHHPIALLAAGTDGRDGPTEAAGAIVDGSTWGLIRAAGRDPGYELRRHNAYRALSAVDAILPRRDTGTNVNDLAIGLIR